MFKLDQIHSKNKYNKGVAATIRYDVVDLGKPGPDDWFRIYKMGNNSLNDYDPAIISKIKDPEGNLKPYLVVGSEDWKAACAERLSNPETLGESNDHTDVRPGQHRRSRHADAESTTP